MCMSQPDITYFGAFEVANGSSPGRTALGSKPMEVLGTYDPIPKPDSYDSSGKLHKDIRLDITRTKYWVGVGAQPTDVVWKLLTMLGILEPKQAAKPKYTPPPNYKLSSTGKRIS
ncbi:mitochondrial ribosomal protein S16 [Pyricularia oryzae Y34]|uniref:Mitochondrial ribosomal protein S16 n=1 Tax=Pyricularia oryzae (strain Y34) TaxID=1143189 RepID=A0AA97NUC6_PYRO3|nr:mitochondrial ribosomal protein S16 [Pyricularia oryzae Y34]